MNYKLSKDMKSVREMLDLSQADLAREIDVDILTIKRIENEQNGVSKNTLEKFYNFVFKKKIYLNKLKEMFYVEELRDIKLLCHGAKSIIIDNIDINVSRSTNDFGKGFYCGETYDQSASFVENYNESRVYYFSFDPIGLKSKYYNVDQKWMLTIAYFRGKLKKYENHIIIKELLLNLKDIDYVVAPIADNKMFRIIDAFINGEITDEQCKHCLAASNLGYQYVLLTEKAILNLKMLECCYLSNEERNSYKKIKIVDNKISDDKVKLARIQYRGKGLYIDEILK